MSSEPRSRAQGRTSRARPARGAEAGAGTTSAGTGPTNVGSTNIGATNIGSTGGKRQVRMVEIEPERAGQRLDNFLLTHLKGVPKSRIYRLIRRGEVRVNRSRARPERRLEAGDQVRIPPVARDERAEQHFIAEHQRRGVESLVRYENDRLLLVDKPAGLAVHGGSGISAGLIETLRAARPTARYLELAHRLDRETSGCLLVAKRRSTLRRLHEALRERRVSKQYLALVHEPWTRTTVVDTPLRRAQTSGERVVAPDPDGGRAARTRFEPIDHWSRDDEGVSLMRVTIDTGRTHQIRVHAAAQGHPVAGDPKYGDRERDRRLGQRLGHAGLQRMFLHAYRLILPEDVLGERLELSAGLPPELLGLVHELAMVMPQDD